MEANDFTGSLCEKPIGLDAAEVRELAAIASGSGAFLMEAMWMKFNPLYAADRSSVRQCRKARQFFAESNRLETFSSITVSPIWRSQVRMALIVTAAR
jgi:predicted dehydrogenase